MSFAPPANVERPVTEMVPPTVTLLLNAPVVAPVIAPAKVNAFAFQFTVVKLEFPECQMPDPPIVKFVKSEFGYNEIPVV